MTCVSTGDEPILNNDLDDTLNDCDGDFEAKPQILKTKKRKVDEFYQVFDSLQSFKKQHLCQRKERLSKKKTAIQPIDVENVPQRASKRIRNE